MFSLISRTALRSATSGTACRSAAAPVLLRQYGATTTQQSVTINKNNTNFNVNSTNNVNASANASTAANNAKPPSSFAFVDGVDYQLIVGNEFARVIRSFSPQDVNTFVSLIHDTNPIHSDASFAAATRFKKPIVPGMLVSSLFSNLLGSKIAGTIYVSQQLRFVRPIYIDEVATAVVTISAIDRKFVTLDSRVYNHQQEIAVEGEAVVYIPSIRGAKN